MRYGECFGMLGPNGAGSFILTLGKTTILGMIIGASLPDSGKILIDGIPGEVSSSDKVSVCPQFDTVWPMLTVEDHLKFYSRCRGISAKLMPIWCRNIASTVNLDGDTYHGLASELSGGMRRRLSIAIALIRGTRTLIFDEPTTGII
jgi:ABC-type multidrug transport system ATPase subunit